jgi:hypothetical protein
VLEAIERRLALGEEVATVLRDTAGVARRLLAVSGPALEGADEAGTLAIAVADAGAAVARVITRIALGRVASERAVQLREELAQERLVGALDRQRQELTALAALVERSRRSK